MPTMTTAIAQPDSPFATLLGRLQALFARPDVTSEVARDDAIVLDAAIAAAVHVIIADGEAAEAEFAAATEGLRTQFDCEPPFEADALTDRLHAAAGRARTRSGRIENLRHVAALAGRPMGERQAVFLLAADVADVEGTSTIEERALAEIAAALDVNRTGLSDLRAGLA
jgi:tellurite resistance protein